ncbi:hypothetical protein QBC46DRAFT_434759 [Diplogelasinospora grovesii]|uniref:Uncharacterized protein n=1 Tax=Diplogelasinospora grovesii TaxID=303347 RepID=A0AAN6N792_9PEZI|nr:hypothetical protein QBC46DRAFT_434759 [Diplogelasinospora grovesii]
MHAESSVGSRNIYEDGDQHNYPRTEIEELTHHSGKNVKGMMPKDQMEEVDRQRAEEAERRRQERYKNDPLFRAEVHGNKPNKGARIDAELKAEEEAMLMKKKRKDSLVGKKM